MAFIVAGILLLLCASNCESADHRHRTIRRSKLASREDLALAIISEQTLSPSRLWREKEELFQRVLNTELDNTIVPENKLKAIKGANGHSYFRYLTRRYDTWYRQDWRLLGGTGSLCDEARFKQNFAARLRFLESRLPEVELRLGGPAQKLNGCGHALCLGCVTELQARTSLKGQSDGKAGWPCPTCRISFTSYQPLVSPADDNDSKSDDNCVVCMEPLEVPIQVAAQKAAKKSRH